jgi:hypothetical protein
LIEIDDINVFEKGFDNDLNNHLPFAKQNNVNYDHTHKFQMEWVTNLNWVGGLTTNEILHNVKCKVCSVIERQPKFLLPK